MKRGSTTKSEITWVAVLRIMACLLVVLAHCCDPFVSSDSVEGFNAGAMWGTITRPSVPLFIMISGVLLIPTPLRIGEFYTKRLKRIVTPFIFWSILSPVIFYIFTHSIETTAPTIIAENHTLGAMIRDLYIWILNFSYSTIPYWYIYMMLGVYLVIPIVSAWVKEATQRELQLILGIWLFTTFVPYIEIAAPLVGYSGNYGSMGIFGVCSWNTFSMFHYVSGFIGYAILAFYLNKYPITASLKRTFTLCAAVWATGYAITLWGFHFTRDNFPENFNMLEIIWSFTSINVLMMTAPIFIIARAVTVQPRKWISTLSQCSYGIFLAHFVIVHIVYELVFNNVAISPVAQIALIAIVSFAITAVVVYTLRLIPIFRKLT